MRFGPKTLTSALLIASTLPAFAGPKVRRGPTSPRLTKTKSAPKSAAAIDPQRATQIQTALVKAGYMTGTPSGTWDASTQAAMEKLQADNGWQTKIVPDARAIIKLGLGPTPASEGIVASGRPAEHEEPTPSEPATSTPANQ